MAAYYNEIDKFAAAWLRELIAAKLIADGEVDERDIREVQADDLRGFTQCHFFAGIGGWSYALRLAGWPDDRPVWTGSCPCQPYSGAGKGTGASDARNLWPSWFRLIGQCKPERIFGEQVESAIGHGWLDLVSTDLEAEGYAIGAAVLGAHSVAAPHIRQRLWFVAHAECWAAERFGQHLAATESRTQDQAPERQRIWNDARDGRDSSELADNHSPRRRQRRASETSSRAESSRIKPSRLRPVGTWDDCNWIPCKDGKYRPIEPGTFPLAHGVPARVGRLRGYGNAIVPQVAAAFIESYLDTIGEGLTA